MSERPRTVRRMSLLDLLDWITLAGVATTVALVLSVVTFWRQEVGKRAASLTVTCEHVPASGKTLSRDYVVVHNAGPATAREVCVRFCEDQENASAFEGGKHLEPEKVTIPAGHSAQLRYSRYIGAWSNTLEVTWRDKRRGRHTLVAPVHVVTVAGPPVVNVTVEQPPAPGPGPARRFPGY